MVTTAEIAEACGLSQPTVSHILTGRAASYSPRTRQRVRQMASQLGYRPNAAARQMRSRRFGAVAMISRKDIALFHFNTVKGVIRGLALHDIHVIQAEMDFARAGKPDQAPRLMRELCVDGFILDDARDIDPILMDQLSEMGVPAVFVNTAGDHDCVNPDDYQAGRRLAEAVLEAGHRRIGFIGLSPEDSPTHYSIQSRADAVNQVLDRPGVHLSPLASRQVDTIDSAEQILASHRNITAWITVNTEVATRLFIAARGLRLDVPGDISIATFRNLRQRRGDHPIRITAPEAPFLEVGMVAAEMLLRKIADPTTRLPVAPVPWSELIGDTLGPPKQNAESANP